MWDPGIPGIIIIIKVAILIYIAAAISSHKISVSNTDLFIKIKRLKAITINNHKLSLVIFYW